MQTVFPFLQDLDVYTSIFIHLPSRLHILPEGGALRFRTCVETAQSEEETILLEHYQKADDVNISHRAHVILLYLEGGASGILLRQLLKKSQQYHAGLQTSKEMVSVQYFLDITRIKTQPNSLRNKKKRLKSYWRKVLCPVSFGPLVD